MATSCQAGAEKANAHKHVGACIFTTIATWQLDNFSQVNLNSYHTHRRSQDADRSSEVQVGLGRIKTSFKMHT